MRQRGQIIDVRDDGGWGFILPDAGGRQIFAHWSGIIQTNGRKELRTGDYVEFEIEQGQRGLHAVNIRVIAKAGEANA